MENIYVSPASYLELIRALDPFTVHTPAWRTPVTRKPARNCGHLTLAPFGCENCGLSHEEIAREERADRYQDQIEWLEMESLRR